MIEATATWLRRHSHINWALADQTMVSGINFLTGILLARGLGIAEFGRFSLVWMVVLFVNSIQHAAINSPMMSLGPKQSEAETPAYYGGVFFQQAIFAVVSTVLTWASVRFAGEIFSDWNIAPLAIPLAAAVLFCQSQDFLRRYFFTVQIPGASVASDAIRYISQIAVLFWVFFVSQTATNISMVLWIMAGTSAAAGFVVFMFVRKLEWTTSALHRTALRNWVSSRWLVASAVLQWLSGNLFIIAAGALLGVTAVGALKAAQNLMGVTHILFQGLENIVPIRAAQHYHAGGAADLLRYLARVTRFGMATTAIIVLIFAIDPVFWLGLLFGEQFTQYGYLVRWYAALYALMFFALPLRFGLRAVEKTAPIFISYIVAAVFSMAVAYPLVREFELTGVMVGMISIQIVMQLTLGKAFRKQIMTVKVGRS